MKWERQRQGRGLNAERLAGWCLLGLLFIAPQFALAQDWYAGLGVGQSKMRDAGDALLGSNVDDKDTGWKIYGGYFGSALT